MANYTRGTARSTASINDELEKIQNSLADKLDRNPTTGQANEMLDDLDMNSKRIYNLPDPIGGQDAVNKDYVDNTLVDLNAQAVTPIELDRETGDGVTVAYTVPNTLSSPARSYLVHLDGVRQKPVTDYNVVGTTLTFTTAPANGVSIDITYYEPQVANNLDSLTVFDTVADAKADPTLIVGDTVKTLGYYTANDGGGAEYVVVTGGTGADDGGSYHNLDNGLQLELIRTGEYHPKQWGAVCDGVTDDTVAIQNLVDSLQSFEGIVLTGELLCGAVNFNNKQRIRITGYNARVKMTGTWTFTTCVSLRIDSVRFEDRLISKAFTGIKLNTGCEGATIERCFIGGLAVGLDNEDNNQNKFLNNQFSANGVHIKTLSVGASTDHQLISNNIFGDCDTDALIVTANNCSIVNNHFESRHSTGKEITTQGVTGNAQQLRIQDNQFFDCKGIEVGNTCVIQNNIFNQPRSASEPVINTLGAQTVVSGNKIFYSSVETGSVGIKAEAGVDISNNYIRRCATGIEVDTVSTSVTIKDNIIESQVGSGITTKGLSLSNCGSAIVANNVFNGLDTYATEEVASVTNTHYYMNRFLNVNGGLKPQNFTGGSGYVIQMMQDGDPNGLVEATPGSIYYRTDGGAGTSLYVKESGGGSTGWVGK